MNLNRKRVLAGLAATGVLAGGLAYGGVALASTGGGGSPATTTATAPATTPAAGWCDGDGYMGGVRAGGQTVMTAAANYLGLTQTQLRDQLQAGKSLADVATAQGKSVSGLKDAILAAVTTRINASTGLTAAQKTALINEVKSHLDDIVNMTHPAGTGMHFRIGEDAGFPMGGMHGMRGI